MNKILLAAASAAFAAALLAGCQSTPDAEKPADVEERKRAPPAGPTTKPIPLLVIAPTTKPVATAAETGSCLKAFPR